MSALTDPSAADDKSIKRSHSTLEKTELCIKLSLDTVLLLQYWNGNILCANWKLTLIKLSVRDVSYSMRGLNQIQKHSLFITSSMRHFTYYIQHL